MGFKCSRIKRFSGKPESDLLLRARRPVLDPKSVGPLTLSAANGVNRVLRAAAHADLEVEPSIHRDSLLNRVGDWQLYLHQHLRGQYFYLSPVHT